MVFVSGGSRNFEKLDGHSRKGEGAHPEIGKIQIFWVSNLEFY
jgi:hypothetical protein